MIRSLAGERVGESIDRQFSPGEDFLGMKTVCERYLRDGLPAPNCFQCDLGLESCVVTVVGTIHIRITSPGKVVSISCANRRRFERVFARGHLSRLGADHVRWA